MLKKKQNQKTKPKKKTTATMKNLRILEFLLIKIKKSNES
jgi:hypothetical protein